MIFNSGLEMFQKRGAWQERERGGEKIRGGGCDPQTMTFIRDNI